MGGGSDGGGLVLAGMRVRVGGSSGAYTVGKVAVR